MAWMACRSCSTRFAVGLLRCPQCGAISELYAVPEEVVEAEQEAQMPKISVAAGPSNAIEETVETTAVDAVQEQDPVESAAPAAQESEPEPESAAESEPEDAGEATPEADEAEPEPAAPAAPKKRAAKKTVAPPKA